MLIYYGEAHTELTHSQQKHALRLIHNENRFYHSKELFESCEIVDVYKLNLLIWSIFFSIYFCIVSFITF